ncbi:MAG: TonB C-terminal domain-containing protein [Desulfobulbaceae bacterium]|nr:TonB C-terminal domain-containing protein [Desulfobulbaceae bacterium]
MPSNEWKLPLNLAIGIHVLVILGGVYIPGFFKAKPKFADIYTVSIVNVAEPMPTQQPQAEVQPESTPPPVPVKPLKAKKLAPIAEVQPTVPVSPAKSISLKPLKRKKKKKLTPKPRQRDLAKERRRKLAEALREEDLLTEKARLAKEALERERTLLQPQQPVVTKPQKSNSAKQDGSVHQSGGSSNLIESQYFASIINRLHQFWALPESLQKRPNLTAVVVITINKNGQIADNFFENKSGDRVFDQFVSRTIEAARPLPPIPPAMKKQRLEIGLVFKPGGIE